jgi:ABC-type histidine transport system ATPase subunit
MKAEVLDVVEELRQSGQRLVLSTHEMSFARHSANHAVFLADGKIVESGTSEELFGNPKSEQVRGFLDRVMKW